jgi:hypothetical protein
MHHFQCWLLRGPLVATLLTCRQVSCRLNSGFPCAKHVIEFLRWTESSSKLHPKTIAVWVDMLYHVSSSQQQALRKPCRFPYETKRFLRCSSLTFRHCYWIWSQVGAALYARVVKAHRDIDPELCCTDGVFPSLPEFVWTWKCCEGTDFLTNAQLC